MTARDPSGALDAHRLRVVIADDEPFALDALRAALAEESGLTVVGEAVDGSDAAEKIRLHRPDVVFLDIGLPEMDGVTVARTAAADVPGGVVFVTGLREHAAEAFALDAADYILKPVTRDRVRCAVARARRRLRAAGCAPSLRPGHGVSPPEAGGSFLTSLWIETSRGGRKLDVSEIEWIEAARDYLLIHTPQRAFIMRATADRLARALDPEVMMRVSRSAIVRLGAVVGARRWNRTMVLVLRDDIAVPVGVTYLTRVQDRLAMPKFGRQLARAEKPEPPA